MSKRNSRAAKAARRQARTTPQLDRAAVAEAIHEAVCLIGRYDGIGHCDAYAFTAAAVLGRLTGQEWFPQAGEAGFGTGIDRDSPQGEVCFAYQPSATELAMKPDGTYGAGLADGELHVWAGRAQGGKVAEIADFAARHVPYLARLSGIGWQREEPAYVWGTPQELHEQRFWFTAEMDSTKFVWETYSANLHSYKDGATLALWRLGVHSDCKAEELMHDPELLFLMRNGYKIVHSSGGGFVAAMP